jgi:glutathione S-transferase
VERCRTQIAAVFAVLEADRSRRASAYWFGDRIGHADIVVATALRFLGEAQRELFPIEGFPALAAHAERLEALPAFKTIYQPFAAPGAD